MRKNLNIAMIGHKRIPSREGGVEIVVEELSKRMVILGHDVCAYSRKGHHVSGKEFDGERDIEIQTHEGIKIISVPTIDNKRVAAVTSSFFATIKAVLACIKGKTKFDCIHYHAEGPCAMIWIPHFLGIRTVATIHGLDWQRAKWGGFATKYIKFGEKMAVKYADEIIVLSKQVQDYFKDTYNRDTVFIPNGVERPQIKELDLAKKKWNIEKDDYILYLGRLVPEKGLHYLIEAFKNIKTDKNLVIAGGASGTEGYVGEVKNMAGDDERIIFTGFVQGQVLDELYSNAYLYCLPSDLEGMPISLLEAMSYGNCSVVSDISECAEVVEDKAVVFKKGDVKELQEKLEWLCDNPDVVQKYKSIASDFICNKYNWNQVVDDTLELYKS